MHPSRGPLFALPVLVASSLLATTALADVHVVDAAGGGDFVDLPAAIAAAAPGDTLLVRAGGYSSFTVNGKPLTIVAEEGSSPVVGQPMRVDNIAAGDTLVLSGLTVAANFDLNLGKVHALIVNSNAGAIRVQDCVLSGADNAPAGQTPFGDGTGGSGVFVATSTNVVLTRCTIAGGRGASSFDCCSEASPGGPGLRTSASAVALYDCTITGGAGGNAGWGGRGGAGVRVFDFGLYASGCTITGGEGGVGDDFVFGPGGDGGAGLRLGATAQAQLLGNALAGGAGGESQVVGPDGDPGPPIDASAGGSVTQFPGEARRFTMPDVGWEGALVPVTVHGLPGDRVWLPASAKSGFRFAVPLSGLWTLQLPVKMLAAPQGVIGLEGQLELLVPITDLAGEGDLRHFQGYVVDLFGNGYLGTPTSFARLGCAFSPDCDASGVPDACEIQSGAVTDCNHNGVPDACDIADGTLPDCNLNGVADACDIAGGTSLDCDQDGVPDECQYDCNGNGIADLCDVQSGFSADCDGNLVPDECDVDCNANGVPDACDIQLGTSFDANQNGVPDECQSPNDVYLVDDDGPPYGADGTPAKPFDTLGKAFVYAIDGNTILVADGTYAGPENRGLDFAGRDLTVASQNGAAAVVIDCAGQDRAFVFEGGTSSAARLEGLTVRNGDAADAQPQPGHGGGVLVRDGSDATLVDCVIELCSAKQGGGVRVPSTSQILLQGCTLRDNVCPAVGPFFGGGGLSAFGFDASGSLTLEGCEVSGNRGSDGGGLLVAAGVTRIVDCVVHDNRPFGAGGGGIKHRGTGALEVLGTAATENISSGGDAAAIYSEGEGSVHISHCVVAGNTGNSLGAGIGLRRIFAVQALDAVVEECLIASNVAGEGAGIFADDVDSLLVRDCTIVANSAATGGGVSVSNVPQTTFRNCVLWDNFASVGGASFFASFHVVDVDHCDVEGGLAGAATGVGGSFLWGAGNLDLDPLFADPGGPDGNVATWADNDLRLGPLSPCADAGDNAAVGADVLDLDGDLDLLEPVPFDLDFLPRFEDDPAVPDTGAGTAPIVDIGAYERP